MCNFPAIFSRAKCSTAGGTSSTSPPMAPLLSPFGPAHGPWSLAAILLCARYLSRPSCISRANTDPHRVMGISKISSGDQRRQRQRSAAERSHSRHSNLGDQCRYTKDSAPSMAELRRDGMTRDGPNDGDAAFDAMCPVPLGAITRREHCLRRGYPVSTGLFSVYSGAVT